MFLSRSNFFAVVTVVVIVTNGLGFINCLLLLFHTKIMFENLSYVRTASVIKTLLK